MRIFKFGGASVKNAEAVKGACEIISRSKDESHLLIVLSAMGKTTNALERVLYAALKNRDKARQLFQEVIEEHKEVVRELFAEYDAEATLYALEKIRKEGLEIIANTPGARPAYFYDQLVPTGELLSSTILSRYLMAAGIENEWFDARTLLKTDYAFQAANIDVTKTGMRIERNLTPYFNSEKPKVGVTQGFIAGADPLNPTTLGREGSDYSAAVFAYFLNARSVTIWKDVPGVLNANPKQFEDTKLLRNISYREAIELSYYGASVIHPKTVQPLQEKRIPLYVKSFYDPDAGGTVINEHTASDSMIPSFIFRENQRLLSLSTRDFAFVAEHNLSDIFNTFSRYHVTINMMQNSAINFSVSIDDHENILSPLIDELKKKYTVLYNRKLQLLTIRHYTDDAIAQLTAGKSILLEQKTRTTARFLLQPLDEK